MLHNLLTLKSLKLGLSVHPLAFLFFLLLFFNSSSHRLNSFCFLYRFLRACLPRHHRTRKSKSSYPMPLCSALPLVSFSCSFSEEAREHSLEYKWDRRFPSFPIEHDQETKIDAMLPLPPKHSSESHAVVKTDPDRIRACSCC